MSVPDSLAQVAIFILFVMPGVTFASVRTALGGWRSPDYSVGARILEAVFVSVLFCGTYALVFGTAAAIALTSVETARSLTAPTIALLGLFLVLVPAAFGASTAVKFRWSIARNGRKFPSVTKKTNFRSDPQAWDHKVLNNQQGCFVRIRTEAGVYYGGWYSTESFASTYPMPRDLFIESQWKMSPTGDFLGKMTNTRGLWLAVTDKCVVEWIAAS